MIRAFVLLLAICWGGLAAAGPVTVTSGEHDGFTRLVFDFGAPVDWRVGRSSDGYEMAITGAAPAYDLRGIFQLIGRSRLAAIWPDPQNGNLRIGIACACHALPFEFRPGIVVIDLRDGPPPKGSSFELALAGGAAPALSAPAAIRPRARPESLSKPFDWLAMTLEGARHPAVASPILQVDDATQLQPLRDVLMQQLARGAAQGVVEMAHPTQIAGRSDLPDFPSAQVRISGGPPLAIGPANSLRPELGAKGEACIAADRLNIETWGSEAPVSVQWGPAMAGLTGEFDRPAPEAVASATRFLLFLGFGAEAQQMLEAFAQDDQDARLWRTLGQILDGEPIVSSVLADQTACDGPAAMWSLLAQSPVTLGTIVNSPAIRLAFSALPLHLRRHLGPPLAERLLALGDTESARAVQDAILRAGGDAGGEVALMQADLASETGDPATAEAHIRGLIDQPGPETAEAIAALVELRAGQALPVDPDTVPALEASLAERAGTDAAPRFRRALTLAHAASGDLAGAFNALPESPGLEPTLWSLLAGLGTDAELMRLAILPEGAAPSATAETRQAIAGRLLELGFADTAALWLSAVEAPDSLLQARVELSQGNERGALRSLAGRDEPEAQALRLTALRRLDDSAAAAAALLSAGQTDEATLVLARAQSWTALAAAAPSTWQALALGATSSPEPAAAEGPLGRGHQLAEAGSATRAMISALLSETPLPGLSPP